MLLLSCRACRWLASTEAGERLLCLLDTLTAMVCLEAMVLVPLAPLLLGEPLCPCDAVVVVSAGIPLLQSRGRDSAVRCIASTMAFLLCLPLVVGGCVSPSTGRLRTAAILLITAVGTMQMAAALLVRFPGSEAAAVRPRRQQAAALAEEEEVKGLVRLALWVTDEGGAEECSVCLEATTTGTRCGHAVCEACLGEVVRHTSVPPVRCPLCRRPLIAAGDASASAGARGASPPSSPPGTPPPVAP